MVDKSALSKPNLTKTDSSPSTPTYSNRETDHSISSDNMLMSEQQVLQLQRTLGNQAVLNILQQRQIQRDSHDKGCRCAACSGADVDIQATPIQRADEHEEDIQAKRIQRDSHGKGCRCAGCSGGADVDIQAMRIQRADEHEEDIQAKLIQRDDGPEEAPAPVQSAKTLVETIKDLIAQAGDAIKAVKDFLITSWNSAIKSPEAMAEIAKTLTVSDFLAVGNLAGTTLKKQLTLAVTHWENVTLNSLKPSISNAPKDQKEEVWKDGELMGKLKLKLGNDSYLDMQPLLGVFKEGTTSEDNKSHTRADKADEYIRQYLAPQVEEAVKAGRKVEGMVAVVDGTEWADAYKREFGDDGEEDTTNAFVEYTSRNIWIHKNRGNAGTIIHEGVHKYTVPAFKTEVGFQFNEGITEYFTRKVTDALNYRRRNYQSNYLFAKEFVSYVGEDKVAKAYFDGAVDELKEAYTDKGKSWATLKTKVKDKAWSDATDLCKD